MKEETELRIVRVIGKIVGVIIVGILVFIGLAWVILPLLAMWKYISN